jgi:hypothetical protein
MSIDAMKQALEFIVATNKSSSFWMVPESKLNKTVTALRLAIEQAEKQEPVINIELSRRMAAVKVSNFYGSIIKDAEKEIERLHGLVLQHTAPPQRQPLTQTEVVEGFCKTPHSVQYVSVFDAGVRFAERKHGITGEKE